MRAVALTAGLFAAGALWSACRGGALPDAEEGSASPQAEPAASSRPDTIDVTLEDYVIVMPGSVPAGAVLRIRNLGAEEHNLRFVREGETEPAWSTDVNLGPGDTLVLTLELEPGSYQALCDFAGHDARGMLRAISVEDAGPTAGQ